MLTLFQFLNSENTNRGLRLMHDTSRTNDDDYDDEDTSELTAKHNYAFQ